jgi:hypothetical protein
LSDAAATRNEILTNRIVATNVGPYMRTLLVSLALVTACSLGTEGHAVDAGAEPLCSSVCDSPNLTCTHDGDCSCGLPDGGIAECREGSGSKF